MWNPIYVLLVWVAFVEAGHKYRVATSSAFKLHPTEKLSADIPELDLDKFSPQHVTNTRTVRTAEADTVGGPGNRSEIGDGKGDLEHGYARRSVDGGYSTGTDPPDTHGAVGEHAVVTSVNSGITITCKKGGQRSTYTWSQFFETETGTFTGSRMRWDAAYRRFVGVILNLNRTNTESSLWFFVSRAGVEVPSARSDWYLLRHPANVEFRNRITQVMDQHWPHYSSLSVDEEAVAVSSNYFTFAGVYGSSGIVVFQKDALYRGQIVAKPPHIIGLTSILGVYFQAAQLTGSRTDGALWFVGFNGLSTSTRSFVQVARVSDPLSDAAEVRLFLIGFATLGRRPTRVGDAAQKGTTALLDTGDSRVTDAVYDRNSEEMSLTFNFANRDLLDLANPSVGPEQPQAVMLRVDRTDRLALYAFSGPRTPNLSTFYSSIALDTTTGRFLVGYAYSNADVYPSAGVAIVDPRGESITEVIVAKGEGPQTRTRWGSYSVVQFDSVYADRVWAQGEIISSKTGMWKTKWAEIQLPKTKPLTAATYTPGFGARRVPKDTTVVITFDVPVSLGSWERVRLWEGPLEDDVNEEGSPEPEPDSECGKDDPPFDCRDGASCWPISAVGSLSVDCKEVTLTFPKGYIKEKQIYRVAIERGAIYGDGKAFYLYPGVPFTTTGFTGIIDSPIYQLALAGDGTGFTHEVFCAIIQTVFPGIPCSSIRIISLSQGSIHIQWQILGVTPDMVDQIGISILANQVTGVWELAFAASGLTLIFIGAPDPAAVGGRIDVTNQPSLIGMATNIVMSIELPAAAGLSGGPDLTIVVPLDLDISATDSFTLTAAGVPTTLPVVRDTATLTATLPATVVVPLGSTIEVSFMATMPGNCDLFAAVWLWGYQVGIGGAPVAVGITNPQSDTCGGRKSIVFGDPHFISLSGGSYEVTGSSGSIYNIISTNQFVWNSRFVAKGGGRQLDTYLGQTGFLVNGTKVTVDATVQGYRVYINGKEATERGVRVALSATSPYFVKLGDGVLLLRAPGYRLALKLVRKAHGYMLPHFDYFLELTDETPLRRNPHGILGQTERLTKTVVPEGKNGQGVIEGTVEDYAVPSLLSTKFAFNRYAMA